MSQTHYLNGVRHGATRQFDANGQLRELANYYSGVFHGSKESFSKYGSLRIAENYKMGKLLDRNGDLMTGLVEYKDGGNTTKYHYKKRTEGRQCRVF
jgi:antitoxin component YwqK of YwqJK toxin-antitoxin module